MGRTPRLEGKLHIPTHILSGWCVGNLLPFNARKRLFCMIAATAADLDGLGIVVSQDAYWEYHHKLGHNFLAAVIFAAVMAMFSSRRGLAFFAYLGLAHLHLVLDYFGSGPGWPIHYGWPATDLTFVNPHAWAFSSWQNLSAFAASLLWTIWIAYRYGRTPIELLAPRLDRKFTGLLRRRQSADNVPA